MLSLIKIAIANNINKTPIAIRIMHKILDKSKPLFDEFVATVVVLGVDVVLVVELLEELLEFVELFVVEFDVLSDLLEVFVSFVLLDVETELSASSSSALSSMFISTANTLDVKEINVTNNNNIYTIFDFLIINLPPYKNKIIISSFNMIPQKRKKCPVFFKNFRSID